MEFSIGLANGSGNCLGNCSGNCSRNGAVSSINPYIMQKHVVEDDILFTNPLAGKGITMMSTSQHV